MKVTHLIAIHNVVNDLRFVGCSQQSAQSLLQTTAGLDERLHHDITVLEESLRNNGTLTMISTIPGKPDSH